MYDLIIIGAGIIGASIARRLSKYKLKILVLDRENDVSMGSSKANSGIIHGGYAEKASELRGKLCYLGRLQFEKLNEELNFGFVANGSLVLAFNESDKKKLEILYKQGLENGVKDLEIIDKDTLREIEPNVSDKAISALYCKGAGITSPYEYVIALMENAIANKVELSLNSNVIDIKKNEYFTVICDDKKEYKSRYLINASGVEASTISNMITKTDFKISGRSGEYLLFQKGTGKRINKVLFQVPTDKSKGILVTRTYHNNILVGPDAIENEGINFDTHKDRLLNIYKEAQKSLKSDVLNLKEFIRSFTGVRAVSSNDDFIIEETSTKGFINVAGIQSPGLTSSPEIARMVEDILKDIGLKLIEDNDYNPKRMPIIEYKELKDMNEIKDKIDLKLGDPQRIVCRCEQVNEETIRDAMNRGIPTETFDSIKRRTRVGMGYCQGSFCRNRVIEVMEDELKREIRSNKFDIEEREISRVGKKGLI